MADNKDVKQIIDLEFKTNADSVQQKTDALSKSTDNLAQSGEKAAGAQTKMSKSMSDNTAKVTKNGGAMAILNTLTGGLAQNFKDAYEASDLFGEGLVGKVLGSIKKFSTGAKVALVSTGIGAFLVVTGLLVAYWEDLVGIVSGLTPELKKQNELAQESLDTEKKKLDTLNGQDNILKLQGKTEEEIIRMKQAQTKEVIKSLEAQIIAQEAMKKSQAETAERNKNILSGILKFLTFPIAALLKAVDMVGEALGQDFNLSGAYDKIASTLFDPDDVKEKADKTIDETKKQLEALKNTEAGYQLSIKAIRENERKLASDHAKKLAEDAKKAEVERLAILKQSIKEREDLERAYVKSIEDLQDKTEEQKLARQKERDLAEIELLKKKGQDVTEALRLNDEKYKILEAELRAKREEERIEREEKERERLIEEAKKQAEIDQAILEQKEALEDAKIGIAERANGLLTVLAGKNKVLQKGAIIAENAIAIGRSLITSAAANVKILAEGAALSLPTGGASEINAARLVAMNNISTGIGVATSIAATAKALSAVGGGSAGGGGVSSMAATPSGGNAPQVEFQNSSENQIANSVSGRMTEQPIQAFVVSSEVSTAQALDRNRIQSNSF